MKRSSKGRARIGVRVACIATVLAALSPTPARADFWCWLFGSGCDGRGGTSQQQTSPERGAPEVDPGTLASAIALAAGGAAMLGDRLRRRRR